MTVQTQDRKEEKAGGQENLTFSFKTIPNHPEHIQVTLKLIATGVETQLTYNTHYTVTLNTDGIGGTAAVLPTFGTEYTQTVWRDTTDKQESDYADYNQFPAETLENDLDRLMCLSQERIDDLSRSAKVGIASDAEVTMPDPVDALIPAWSGTGGTMVNVSNSAQALAGALVAQEAAEVAATTATTQAIVATSEATSSASSAAAAAVSAAQLVVDDVTLESTGNLHIKALGVDTAQIAANAVTTVKILNSNVTKAKIENLADYKVLGNVSGGAAAPSEVDIIDDDSMATAAATNIPSAESVKEYVDASVAITYDDTDTTILLAHNLVEKTHTGTTYAKKFEWTDWAFTGTITVTFLLKTGNASHTAFARVYIDGAPVGVEKSEEGTNYVLQTDNAISITKGQSLQIYSKNSSGASAVSVDDVKVYSQFGNPTSGL